MIKNELQDLRAYAADFVHCMKGHDGGAGEGGGDECNRIVNMFSEEETWAFKIIQPIFDRIPFP